MVESSNGITHVQGLKTMMARGALSESDIGNIGNCLRVMIDEKVIPDWELPIVLGAYPAELLEVTLAWPDVNLSDELPSIIVSGVLNNLVGYPHGKQEQIELVTNLSSQDISGIRSRLVAAVKIDK